MKTSRARFSEKQLDQYFEAAVRDNAEFRQWILDRAGFSDQQTILYLSRSDWPWYVSPSTGKQSETDVLLVFQDSRKARFAIHVENKLASGKLTLDQSEGYGVRAQDWCNIPKYGNYSFFKTVLIAPIDFIYKYACEAAPFDCRISHEEIGEFVMQFKPGVT